MVKNDYIKNTKGTIMLIQGYTPVFWKLGFVWIFTIVSFGLLRLMLYWQRYWYALLTCKKCAIKSSKFVLIKDEFKSYHLTKIQQILLQDLNPFHLDHMSKFLLPCNTVKFQCVWSFRFFVYKGDRYIYNKELDIFENVNIFDFSLQCSSFYSCKPLTPDKIYLRNLIFGQNIIKIDVYPFYKTMFFEVLSPFNIFQILSIILWYNDEYELYASCILSITLISLCLTTYQIQRNQKALNLLSNTKTNMEVIRDTLQLLPSENLLPGDIIKINSNITMPCDAVLINGSCIMDESLLTGESFPITKTQLPFYKNNDSLFIHSKYDKHILYSGTKVIQTRYYDSSFVKAVVLRTGYQTTKGNIIKSIQFPPPTEFHFDQDCYKFIFCLFLISLIGFVYTIVLKVRAGVSALKIALRALDIITIIVPPTLPAAMAIGVIYANQRLRKYQIFCISPNKINVCGIVDTVCFDKTGTLTGHSLEIKGFILKESCGDCSSFMTHPSYEMDVCATEMDHVKICMATCHSLSLIRDNEICGDPLEMNMFKFTSWHMTYYNQQREFKNSNSPINIPYDHLIPITIQDFNAHPSEIKDTKKSPRSREFAVVRQFPFVSSLQRMSVITREFASDNYQVYCKGSPELFMQKLCNASTIPSNTHILCNLYASRGYRIIALATKTLPTHYTWLKIQRIPREEIECNLTFLGLVVFENKVKPNTSHVIRELKNADIDVIMVTGDNMLTALYTARQCGIIGENQKVITLYSDDSQLEVGSTGKSSGGPANLEDDADVCYAITGATYAKSPAAVAAILNSGKLRVAARMCPEGKAHLVRALQRGGRYVAMCGDGANDCSALKAAHAGIALTRHVIIPDPPGGTLKSSASRFRRWVAKFIGGKVAKGRAFTDSESGLTKGTAQTADSFNNDNGGASLAAPFTATCDDIGCVVDIITEGRAALATSFGLFKYMAVTSMIQFAAVLLLHWNGANLSDPQFTYVDLITITTLALLSGFVGPPRSKSSNQGGQSRGRRVALSSQSPESSLTGLVTLASVASHVLLHTCFAVLAYSYASSSDWFVPYDPSADPEESYVTHEVSAIFCTTAFQYITLAVLFSARVPHRSPWYSNSSFTIAVFCLTVFGIAMTLGLLPHRINEFLCLALPPFLESRFVYLSIAFYDFVLAYVLERWIINRLLVSRASKSKNKSSNNPKYGDDSSPTKFDNVQTEIKFFQKTQCILKLPYKTQHRRNSFSHYYLGKSSIPTFNSFDARYSSHPNLAYLS